MRKNQLSSAEIGGITVLVAFSIFLPLYRESGENIWLWMIFLLAIGIPSFLSISSDKRGKTSVSSCEGLVTMSPVLEDDIERNRAIIAELRAGMDRLFDIRCKIYDQDVTIPLRALENKGRKLQEFLESHENRAPRVRHFVQYYVPRTVSFAKAFYDIDHQNLHSESAAKPLGGG